MLRAVVLTQYRRDGRTDRRTDRQTDGIAVASTALAMPALRRAVKTLIDWCCPSTDETLTGCCMGYIKTYGDGFG